MPTQSTINKARKAKREGKSPSTQAGAFVKKEMDEIRSGKHGARSPKQAIAIGLSEARRAGVKVPPAPRGSKSARKKSADATVRRGKKSATRSKAALKALKREPTSTGSKSALSKHAHEAAHHRGARSRHESAMKAVRTKGKAGLRRAAHKAAVTREHHAHA